MAEISIVIPSYRRPELLARALASCVGQRDVDVAYEIVVIDNDPAGSAAPTVEAAARDSAVPIRYFVEDRPGISHARNSGVAHAASPYIAFLDDDEAADPIWLSSMYKTIRAAEAEAVVGPVHPVFPADVARIDGYSRKIYTRDVGLPTGTRLPKWNCIGNTLIDRERCIGISQQPFNPRLGLTGGEDDLFLRQLLRTGGKIVWCAEAVVREVIPHQKLLPRYLLQRAFGCAQGMIFVFTEVEPPEWGLALYWMAIGSAQAVLYTPLALLLRAVRHERWLAVSAKAVAGLGKVLWHPALHLRRYR